MPSSSLSVHRKKTSQSAVLCGFVLAVIGAGLLLFSGDLTTALQGLAGQLGGLLVTTAVVSIGWDLYCRRQLIDEILAMVRVSQDIERSGLKAITSEYLGNEIPWSELLQDTKALDILATYGSTWRKLRSRELHDLAARQGTAIRVFLPDPDDDLSMATLSRRFGGSPESIASRTRESIEYYSDLRCATGASVEVFLHRRDSLFGCYRFDNRAVLRLYMNRPTEISHAPTFMVAAGHLMDFVDREFESIRSASRLHESPMRVDLDAIAESRATDQRA